MFLSRFLVNKRGQSLQATKMLSQQTNRIFSSNVEVPNDESPADHTGIQNNIRESPDIETGAVPLEYRFLYPEFLPDPNPLHRNSLREKLERIDMLARRNNIGIPEFYVGSILGVTYSEQHAPGKVNRFVGICIQRTGCGLMATFTLRNVVDNQGVEMKFNLYDPTITDIDCLRLEKRLDNELLYLRDAPMEYSTFPFDMTREVLLDGTPVPLNDIVVPLNPPPWLQKYELFNFKGLSGIRVSQKRQRKAALSARPWEKYDLMKIYRSTIPEEEQNQIFSQIQANLRRQEIERLKMRRKRSLTVPKNI